MFSLPPTSSVPIGAFYTIGPLHCVIETKKYEVRSGKDWMNVSPADYGFIEGFLGADGDFIDCYIGPNLDSRRVFVIDQGRRNSPHLFDEHKVMLGYDTKDQAIKDFMLGHHEGPKIFQAMVSMSMNQFTRWLQQGDLTQPIIRR